MITLTGKSACGGIAIGQISFYKRKRYVVEYRRIQDVEAEIARFEAARTLALDQIHALCQKATQAVGKENAMIFHVHQRMLEDPDYCESVTGRIRTEQVTAEYAVSVTADQFAQMFASLDDAYMQERAMDVKDISARVLGILSGQGNGRAGTETPSIIAADDLVPSETVQLDKGKVLGFATMYGAPTSHTAILARTMNIPAVIGLGENLKEEYDATQAVIDGFTGVVYIDPDEKILAFMREKQKRNQEHRKLLLQLRGKENITLDGRRIEIAANIGGLSDLDMAIENDAGGIGLFRSEFLYMERNTFPSEEQQFTVYKTVAQKMKGKRVIIRTLDLSADKQVDCFHLEKEENPALGYRAIRISLTRPDIFKTQLRAVYRASAFGWLAVMFPMVISLDEVKRIKTVIHQVKEELKAEGTPFDEHMEIGVMIETPAAAVISDQLAKEVDFFSVGTNDLTQYTLAIDRQNPRLNSFYNPYHPAVLRLIRMTAENAHREGKWIGICGELGADPEMTGTFLAMGIDELSVSPGLVLGLRKLVRETDLSRKPENRLQDE